jgi:hypothetical protein
MKLVIDNEQKRNTFKLLNQPMDYQIGYHMSNLIGYFHPLNTELRHSNDKEFCYPTSRILAVFEELINNPFLLEASLVSRWSAPLQYRCANMLRHYGVTKMAYWLYLVYHKQIFIKDASQEKETSSVNGKI